MTKSRFLSSLSTLTALAVCAFSQETAPSPAGEKAPAKLRVWVFPGAGSPGSLSIGALGADGSVVALGSASREVCDAAYRDMPVGKYSFAVKDGEKSLCEKQVQLGSAECSTLVAWKSNGEWNLEFYGDNASKSAAVERSLRLLNFAQNAQLTVIAGAKTAKLGPSSLQELKVPAKITPLDVSALAPGATAPARTLSEVDLSSAPAVYVLVSPDYRGRLRPQIIRAGELLEAAD